MRQPPDLVISIQSQVVSGHVGNSAAQFPLQAVGLEVAAVPTVLLASTPHYRPIRGRAIAPDLFADVLTGLRERQLAQRARYLVTGYIGSPEIAALTADFVAEAKADNPALTYICDPVIGDTSPGIYVPDQVVETVRTGLLPLADVATPNAFEFQVLANSTDPATAFSPTIRAHLGLADTATLVVTGGQWPGTAACKLETLVIDGTGLSRHDTDRVEAPVSGTGDLFTALLLASLSVGESLRAAVDRSQRLTRLAMDEALALDRPEIMLTNAEFLNEIGGLRLLLTLQSRLLESITKP